MLKYRYKTAGRLGAYKTYSLLEKKGAESVTGIPLPSLEAVELAKRAVDENEL
ncbi:MAG: hypothetical protein ABFC62_00975 [Clostridiaceae bacterium]|nr:hypothetical protein [Eubacteriales bacterium]